MCWDGKVYKVSSHSFKAGALRIPTGYSGSLAEVEAKSNAAVDKVKENGIAATKSDDSELNYKGLSFIEAVVAVKEATLTLCNEAKVPEKFWDDKNSDYPNSPFHGPTLSGVGNGAIAELKDIPELVGFGLEIATDPEKAKATWSGIKSITPAKVKKMLLGAASEKLAKYTAGGNTMKHEAGKDGVQMAMFVVGAVKSIGTNASKIAELEEVVAKLDNMADDVGDVADDLGNAVDELTGKTINKELKDGILDDIDLEKQIDNLVDLVENSGIKATEPLYKANRKRGNDFNTRRQLDYDESEVTVEHPTRVYTKGKNKGNPKRYRVDSYSDGRAIVSRKATDLSKIKKTTFEKHLRELVSKYPEGAKIVTPSKPLINGKTLKGDFILEIPDSNLSFFKLQEYKDLASKFMYNGKEYNIKIVLKPE